LATCLDSITLQEDWEAGAGADMATGIISKRKS
jgi:hypothetical protein